MKIRVIILTLLLVSFFGCKKDKNVFPGGEFSSPEYVFLCDTLPQEPPVGWKDTSTNADKDVLKVLYNPINSNELIYIVRSKNYSSEMYYYNRQTKITKSIDKSVFGMPRINMSGWLVYTKVNFQIYKIKYNGDSLQKLTTSSVQCSDPYWDYTNNFIYYTQNSLPSNPYGIIKMNKEGVKIDSLMYPQLIGLSLKSNKIISMKVNNQLFIKDLNTGIEKTLRTGNYNYFHLTFDNSDENIYWWENYGIFRINLTTLKLDTLVKTCPLAHFLSTPSYELYSPNVSPNTSKLTFTQITNKEIPTWKLFHEYHALEMDLNTGRITEIKLFQ